MREKKVNDIELPAAEESFEKAQHFFRQRLEAEAISKELVSETMLVVEALFHNLLEQGIGSETTLRLSCRKSLGNVVVRIGYEGKMAYLLTEEDGVSTPENRILQAYEDRIDSRYQSGFNSFQITVRRKHLRSLLYCAVGILCACLVYLPIRFLMTRDAQLGLVRYYLLPTEQFFGNAALMIGAPVTFFSLLENLTNTYVLADRYSVVRKLRAKATVTSLITVLLAVGISFLLLSRFQAAPQEQAAAATASAVFSGLIAEAVPASIFEPFESISPIPLIVVALILTYSFCSTGKYFMKLKQAVDVGYTVFSKMLGLVLFAFPFFFFVSSLELLIIRHSEMLMVLVRGILLILAGTAGLALFYLIRLVLAGVRLKPFLQKLPPLLLENCRINSSLDAVPFNIRYCARHYGMNRKLLESSLPFLAQIVFDGNCFLLTSVAMFLAFNAGAEITWYNTLVSAILVFFLSLGAPNQPGSMLIGTMILLQYQGYEGSSYMFIAILFEAALGIVQNLINVVGDIVTVAIEDHQLKNNS